MSDLTSPAGTGLRGEIAVRVKENVRQLLMMVLTNEVFHADVVAAGPFEWRRCFGKDMGAFFDGNRSRCDDLANSVYNRIALSWANRHPNETPEHWLDHYQPPSVLTEAEIDDAWELEIGSSESALKQMYEGSCRVRKGKDLGSRRIQ